MFIPDPNKSLFQVMADFDCASDPEQRWKDLRNGVSYYNCENGTKHEFTGEMLNLYWTWNESVNYTLAPELL
jgi:hypothetical protein